MCYYQCTNVKILWHHRLHIISYLEYVVLYAQYCYLTLYRMHSRFPNIKLWIECGIVFVGWMLLHGMPFSLPFLEGWLNDKQLCQNLKDTWLYHWTSKPNPIKSYFCISVIVWVIQSNKCCLIVIQIESIDIPKETYFVVVEHRGHLKVKTGH